MKRFLLSGVLLLVMGRTAFCYVNNGVVQVPPMDPSLIQIDDVNFVNNNRFVVDLTSIQNAAIGVSVLYSTTDTLNYTNKGVMIGVPGFDFETFPASIGQAHMLANFVNTNGGIGSGIFVTNIYGGASLFGGGVNVQNGLISPINFDLVGLARVKVRATNVVDSGLIMMDNSGLIDISGKNVDLRRAQFVMTGGNAFSNSTFGISFLDFGSGLFGNTNNNPWDAFDFLTPTTATTPFFQTVGGGFDIMVLSNATPYFQDLNPQPGPDGIVVWRGIYLQDSSPPNVTKNVYFDASGVGGGAFHIEWVGEYRDPTTGLPATNYFYLSDVPANRRNTNGFFAFPPSDFSFAEGPTKLLVGNPAAPGFVNPAPPGLVSNDFSYISVKPNAVLVDTNQIVGGSVTNLPGRIQFTGSGSLNLANVRVIGPNYVSLNSSVNFLGNSNAVIAAPYSDLNLGVTNGSLTFSNLLVPGLPSWSGVPGAPSAVLEFPLFIPIGGVFAQVPAPMGGIQAWSGSYIFVDANGVTNDVRMLLVNSALQPTTPVLQQDVFLHATNSLVISDQLNIFRHFSSDATALTLTTNDNSAFSLFGQLNLLSQDIFWSTSLPNLQYLTNFGVITTANLANFAGNMTSPTSDPTTAVPYQAFVNHGGITNQGTFIRANYFENSGQIQEGASGGIDIGVTTTAIATNGAFIAPEGEVSIAANSLFVSNGVIIAGQDLTLNVPCSLSDGYVLGNQFGHITNSILPTVVTNGNTWTAGGGVRIVAKPPTADLLGTTITNISLNGASSDNIWPGEDRGNTPGGYATNLALGRMILVADANPSQFVFRGLNNFLGQPGSNALYVDAIEFQGSVTNTDINGNFPSITIVPGMKIYYAQATMNGVSIAEKLNNKNGGGFLWVSNYAGVYSSTNIPYPDGNTYIFNDALAISPDIDSDGDGTVNRDDQTPISIGSVFDIVNIGPQPCDSPTGNPPGGPGNPPESQNPVQGRLVFPIEQSSQPQGSNSVLFALAQGSYNGLFYDTNGVNPASSGSFTAKVTSKGGLSAKLELGNHNYSFSKPPFDGSGHFHGSVTGKNLATLTVDLQLVNNDEITGTVSGNGWTAQLLAERAAFSSKNKTPWVGSDTLLLATDEENSSMPAAGDAFGSVTVSKSGDVQFSGVLPDGTKVSQKSALSKDGIWPLYYAPYSGAGSFIGWMRCTNDSEIAGSAVWIAPAQAGGFHPHGLTNSLDATGSGTLGSIGALSQNTTILSGATSISSITNTVTISGKNGQSADGTLKLSVNAKTGLFTGSVTVSGTGQKLSVQGALLEKSEIGGGFFLNADKSQGGKVSLTPAN